MEIEAPQTVKLSNALNIVIVDDDEMILLVLRKSLESFGYNVVGEAGDGEKAIELVKSTKPQMVFMDIRMPKMDGFHAARVIQLECPVPLIFISAFHEEGLGGEAARLGAHAFLVKPFKPEDIKPVVELALVNYKKQKDLEEKIRETNEALKSRKLIERAKGIFMKQTGTDEETAYLTLQRKARNENKKMVEVAEAVIMAEQLKSDGLKPLPNRKAVTNVHRPQAKPS